MNNQISGKEKRSHVILSQMKLCKLDLQYYVYSSVYTWTVNHLTMLKVDSICVLTFAALSVSCGSVWFLTSL